MSVELKGLYPQTGDAIGPMLPENAMPEQLDDYNRLLFDFQNSLPGAGLIMRDTDWKLLSNLLNQINVIKHLDIENDIIKGIENVDDCELLAKHLSRHVNFLESFNYDRIYMKTGNWYTFDNNPISNSDIIEALNTLTPTFFVVLPKIGKDIIEYHPECSLELDNLKRFHSFLESCGGFTTIFK
jgi:hypothetical protein